MVKLFGSVHDYVRRDVTIPSDWADYCHVTFRVTSARLIYVRRIVQFGKMAIRRLGGISIGNLLEAGLWDTFY
jgi:hypothetical protein